MTVPSDNLVRAAPRQLAEFFLKCNTDDEFRKMFLKDPIHTLREFKIQIGESAEKEIAQQVADLVKHYEREIYVVPKYWLEENAELLKNGYGIRLNVSRTSDDPIVIP